MFFYCQTQKRASPWLLCIYYSGCQEKLITSYHENVRFYKILYSNTLQFRQLHPIKLKNYITVKLNFNIFFCMAFSVESTNSNDTFYLFLDRKQTILDRNNYGTLTSTNINLGIQQHTKYHKEIQWNPTPWSWILQNLRTYGGGLPRRNEINQVV